MAGNLLECGVGCVGVAVEAPGRVIARCPRSLCAAGPILTPTVADDDFDIRGAGVEIALAGAAGLAGGPGGAAAAGGAAALGKVIDWVRLKRFDEGVLAELQSDRLEEAILEAGEVIKAMRMNGHTPRTDWFDIDLEKERVVTSPSGIELLEGTLIGAANEFERRKVRLLANLWAQLAFNPSVTYEEAIYLVRVVDNLSYQQLAILAVVTELHGPPPAAEDANLDLSVAAGPVVDPYDGYESSHPFRGSETNAMEILDLIRRGVLAQQEGGQVPFNPGQVKPWRCRPTLLGRRIYVLTAMRTHVRLADKETLRADLVKWR